ncbi:MAG TPA: serine protease [Nakamurella multipartita]|nr:serine protease [Nakamurella multipartita]
MSPESRRSGPSRFGADLAAELKAALSDLDMTRAVWLCSEIAGQLQAEPTQARRDVAERALRMAAGKRLNPQTIGLGEALIGAGYDEPLIRHRYALALIDSGCVAAASALLPGGSTTLSPDVSAEIEGARGRIAKERYLSGPGAVTAPWLAEAIRCYHGIYRRDPARYHHGINAAALLSRAVADGLEIDGFDDRETAARQIAQDILSGFDSVQKLDIWQCATAAEANLVLGDPDRVVAWVLQYTGSEADSFEFGSTLRQFEQVWGLTDDTEPGRRVLPMLQQAVLRSSGGRLLLRSDDAAQRARRIGSMLNAGVANAQALRSLTWLRAGLTAGQAVGRIDSRGGRPIGTCFLVSAEGAAPVILTCSHVVPFGITPDDAEVTFHGAEVRPSPITTTMVFNDPDLDATVLRPERSVPGVQPLRAPALPQGFTRPKRPQISLIGHPRGSDEQWMSMDSATVVGVDDRWITYRSPTMEGNSGSPAFDENWTLVGMHSGHHASSHANRAVRLDRIPLSGD